MIISRDLLHHGVGKVLWSEALLYDQIIYLGQGHDTTEGDAWPRLARICEGTEKLLATGVDQRILMDLFECWAHVGQKPDRKQLKV